LAARKPTGLHGTRVAADVRQNCLSAARKPIGVAQGGHRGVRVAEERVRRRHGSVAHEVGQLRREPLWHAGRRVVVCERAAVAGAPSKGATHVLMAAGTVLSDGRMNSRSGACSCWLLVRYLSMQGKT
jgi:hypothetical protein